MSEVSDLIDALAFAFSRIDKPHQHHRHCVHNLTYEEQYAQRKRRHDGPDFTDEEMQLFGLDRGIVVITPDDWEVDVPDLDWSRFDEESR